MMAILAILVSILAILAILISNLVPIRAVGVSVGLAIGDGPGFFRGYDDHKAGIADIITLQQKLHVLGAVRSRYLTTLC